ncbi:hypothetical protein N7448_007845 [Penicillium atrosanguineum]|uniref:RING-type domain-containing protein n=1 Tax=Penicillium atrosanguineum TaxID=1132637 RepID=A0A9W9UCF4_9EURO|nr:uncharacterized protein N7443_001134 [Penicillium atrosanguineum]KAJ5127066.1 hypothetical protein N7448_007845 [Penicillium atrosanguineum]KAJ5147273.1 hypothetical protein N7526_000625 [Penicillium atrosanguineum]KAJ5314250.1 hypothetical protein N7443_001134 [Penicillium atrosanguineum]KAJ5331416.1 hypothetical protein N7476_001199 [Penicillium atrosanguineum]
MARRTSSDPEPLDLDPISTWRALHALSIYFTVLLNRQLRRRWLLEHKCMKDKPASDRFFPFVFLESIPTLPKPRIPSSTNNIRPDDEKNPYNAAALSTLKAKVHLLRGRVEKGKELASEIERRMLDPLVTFPTHFCHTCVVGGDEGDVLLTKCGHKVCRTCLGFGVDGEGRYDCSICFLPAQIVHSSPLGPHRSCSENFSSVSRTLLPKGEKVVQSLRNPLVIMP